MFQKVLKGYKGFKWFQLRFGRVYTSLMFLLATYSGSAQEGEAGKHFGFGSAHFGVSTIIVQGRERVTPFLQDIRPG